MNLTWLSSGLKNLTFLFSGQGRGLTLEIQKKGKKEIYTFLPIEEIERIMRSIGFIDLNFQKTFAGQAWVISAYKAQNITLESKKI